MEIGFHVRTHDALTTLGRDELERAVAEGRATLAAAASQRIQTFAYPHGSAGPREAAAVRAAGYACAFTTEGRAVTPLSNPFLFPRLEPSFASPGHFAAQLAVAILRGLRDQRDAAASVAGRDRL